MGKDYQCNQFSMPSDFDLSSAWGIISNFYSWIESIDHS